MITNSNQTASMLFSGFRNESEEEDEEGMIKHAFETDPKMFQVNVPLSPLQLFKFLEYFTMKSPEEKPTDFKYSKIYLNKISNITHNHFHLISRDLKLFKLYKKLIQIVTQDMYDWVTRDCYCGETILEILREVQSHKELPMYNALINKLRINEIIERYLGKVQELRRVIEENRLKNKRMRNFEKKKKKFMPKIDPFDSIQLPIKRPAVEMYTEEIKTIAVGEKISNFGLTPTAFFTHDLIPQILQISKEPFENDLQIIEDPGKDLEIDEWFQCIIDKAFSNIGETISYHRENYKNLDPRIFITLQCRGLDYMLSNPNLSNELEKFTVIINIKCLVSVVSQTETKKLKDTIPKDTIQVHADNEKFLVSFRKGAKELLEFLKKIADFYVFSEYSEKLSSQIFPLEKVIFSKKNDFSRELLIIFDNDTYGWESNMFIPLLHYSLLGHTTSLTYNMQFARVKELEHAIYSESFAVVQLEKLQNTLKNVYSSCIEHDFQHYAIWEFKKYMKTIFEGVVIDISRYQQRIGQLGYTENKLNLYISVVQTLGGRIGDKENCLIVEEKNEENEVSAVWVLASFWCFETIQKI